MESNQETEGTWGAQVGNQAEQLLISLLSLSLLPVLLPSLPPSPANEQRQLKNYREDPLQTNILILLFQMEKLMPQEAMGPRAAGW